MTLNTIVWASYTSLNKRHSDVPVLCSIIARMGIGKTIMQAQKHKLHNTDSVPRIKFVVAKRLKGKFTDTHSNPVPGLGL